MTPTPRLPTTFFSHLSEAYPSTRFSIDELVAVAYAYGTFGASNRHALHLASLLNRMTVEFRDRQQVEDWTT